MLLEQARYFVDHFHVKGYNEPVCNAGNRKCKHQTDMSRFSNAGVNIKCTEQAFDWLGRFKKVSRQMTIRRFVFLNVLINELAVVPVLRTGCPTFLIHFQSAFQAFV